jgi:hypothetical protein
MNTRSAREYAGVLISIWLFLFASHPKEFFLDGLKKLERVGFEPTIPAFERAKTVHALDRVATGIADKSLTFPISNYPIFSQPK